MIIDSQVGRFTVTADASRTSLLLVSRERETLRSVLNSIELAGDTAYPDSVIDAFSHFGETRYRATVSRRAALLFFQVELLHYLTYPSLNKMKDST